MRKTICTALVTLLVMLAASCNTGDKPDDGLVTLSIRSDRPIDLPDVVTASVTNSLPANVPQGISRSLTTTDAHSKAAYVEVIFKHTDGTYFQKADYFDIANPLEDFKISVKGGTYNTNQAIMLIGTMDGTLLATGVPSAGITVPTVTSITFNVTSLTSNISAVTIPAVASPPAPAAIPAIPPDFSIDNPVDTAFSGKTTATDKFVIPEVAGKHPCFQVPKDTTDIEASLTINGLTDSSSNIIVSAVPTVKFLPTSPTITYTITTPASTGSAIGTTKQLAFKFTTTGVGQYRITFDIPVYGFAEKGTAAGKVPNGITWHIKGGTKPGWDVTGTDPEEGIALIVITNPDSYDVSVGLGTWTP